MFLRYYRINYNNLEPASARKAQEDEEHIRRAAEREGRRTRRRCDREKNNFVNIHLDGMSSDDELPDQELSQYKNSLGNLYSMFA